MKLYIIGLILALSPIFSFAHNPLSARYYFEAGKSVSLLSINLSQDGMNQALLKQHSKEKLDAMSQKEFEELIVTYVKANFSLALDDKEVKLKEGGIKLGSHQTDLKFVLPPVTKELAKLDVHISAFQENKNHQSIFSYQIYEKNSHVILSNSNNYQSSIVLSQIAKRTSNRKWFMGIGLLGLMGILTVKMLNSKKINT